MANYSRNQSIPTGGAPLYLGDFASPTTAVFQRMNKDLIAQSNAAIKQMQTDKKNSDAEKLRYEKEKLDLLKSLDFDTVEGMSEEIKAKHLKRVNELTDKWSKELLNNDMKLTLEQRQNLQKDKRKIEQDIADMKHNLGLVANAQKELGLHQEFYHPRSFKKLQEYISKNDITKSAHDILELKFDMRSHLKKIAGGLKGEPLSERMVWDGKSDTYKKISSNEQAVLDKYKNIVSSDPIIQQQLADPYNAVAKENQAIIDAYGPSLVQKKETEHPATEAMRKERLKQSLTTSQKSIDNKGRFLERGAKPEDLPTLKYQHDFAYKVLKKDKSALKQLEGDVNVSKDAISFIDDKGRVVDKIDIPDFNDQDAVRTAMLQVIDRMPGSAKFKPDPGLIDPTWETELGDTIFDQNYEKFKSDIEKGPIKKEDARETLKNIFGEDADVDEKTIGTYKIEWDGETYNLKSEEARKKLLKDVEEKGGFIEEKPKGEEEKLTRIKKLIPDTSENDKDTVISGVDIEAYATSPTHEKNVKSVYEKIKPKIDQGLSSYENLKKDFNKVIQENPLVKKNGGSPINSDMIIDAAFKYKVDPILLAAIMEIDSHYGTDGKAVRTKNPGNVGNDDAGNLLFFDTWEDGVEAVAKWLSGDRKGARVKGTLVKPGEKEPQEVKNTRNEENDPLGLFD